jgi:transcriptional regulator with XRE-family HTH domain
MEPTINLEIFATKVREKMSALGINQAHLAKESGITASALSQLFNKDKVRVPSTIILVKLANTLGVSIDYLLGRTDNPNLEDILQHDKFRTMMEKFLSLSETDQKRILDMIELMTKS